jgi:hypothetical protein
MAHFAKLGSNSKVIQVLTLNNGDMLNADGVEDESVGQQYLETHNNWPAQMWIQTSYNTSNIFWPKKPHASWVKHNASASWKSPIGDAPALTEEQTSQNTADTHSWSYVWNETNTTWDLTDSKA